MTSAKMAEKVTSRAYPSAKTLKIQAKTIRINFVKLSKTVKYL